MRYLIVESESAEERAGRRNVLGMSSGESFAATLRDLVGCEVELVRPGEDDVDGSAEALGRFDAVFLSGSPIHVYDGSTPVRRIVGFMNRIFASGVPSFGSCAGLHIAVAAAGGTVRPMPNGRMEAGIARRIRATDAGRSHELLQGRDAVWDAPSIHGDEVETLPLGARLLATNAAATVQAAEIEHGGGVFWGVQYHPELSPGEIAAALRRQAEELVSSGISEGETQVDARASQLDALQRAPDHTPNRWMLGIDAEFAETGHRRREIRNFIKAAPSLRQSVRS